MIERSTSDVRPFLFRRGLLAARICQSVVYSGFVHGASTVGSEPPRARARVWNPKLGGGSAKSGQSQACLNGVRLTGSGGSRWGRGYGMCIASGRARRYFRYAGPTTIALVDSENGSVA